MIYKILAGLAIIGAIFSGGYISGYKSAENKLQPIINERDAQLLAIDLKAKQDEQTYERNLNVIKNENSDSVNRLNARYDRLLHTKSNISASGVAEDSKGINVTAEESAIAFERACALDANQVVMLQDWVKLNKIPIQSD